MDPLDLALFEEVYLVVGEDQRSYIIKQLVCASFRRG